jgi:hypothetical protein
MFNLHVLLLIVQSICARGIWLLHSTNANFLHPCAHVVEACYAYFSCIDKCLLSIVETPLSDSEARSCDTIINSWHKGLDSRCDAESIHLQRLLMCYATVAFSLMDYGEYRSDACDIETSAPTTASAKL